MRIWMTTWSICINDYHLELMVSYAMTVCKILDGCCHLVGSVSMAVLAGNVVSIATPAGCPRRDGSPSVLALFSATGGLHWMVRYVRVIFRLKMACAFAVAAVSEAVAM